MSKDRSLYVLVAIAIGMSCTYALADDSKVKIDPAEPFHMAIAFGVSLPNGTIAPLGFGVLEGGFATEAECMGKKGGADNPAFHKFVEKFVTDLSKQIGMPVEVKAGCIDATKLPKDDKPVPGGEKL